MGGNDQPSTLSAEDQEACRILLISLKQRAREDEEQQRLLRESLKDMELGAASAFESLRADIKWLRADIKWLRADIDRCNDIRRKYMECFHPEMYRRCYPAPVSPKKPNHNRFRCRPALRNHSYCRQQHRRRSRQWW